MQKTARMLNFAHRTRFLLDTMIWKIGRPMLYLMVDTVLPTSPSTSYSQPRVKNFSNGESSWRAPNRRHYSY